MNTYKKKVPYPALYIVTSRPIKRCKKEEPSITMQILIFPLPQMIHPVDRRGSRLTPDFRFIKEARGALTITNVMVEDNGKWTCEAENAHGYSENARPVKLVVLGECPLSLCVWLAIHIIVQRHAGVMVCHVLAGCGGGVGGGDEKGFAGHYLYALLCLSLD